jgi:superfamily I DNA/RNA helicase
MRLILRPQNFWAVGDSRQAIYAFKGANYEIFMGLTEDPFTEVYELRDCYRCGPEVIDFANSHIRKVNHIYRTPTKCVKPYGGTTVDEDEFSYQAILATIQEIGDYKNTTVLCRSNAMVDDVLFYLKRNEIPAFTFKKGEKTYIELQEELKSDAVKVLTVHSAKGLEWNNVIVCQEVQPWNDEECRINYVAATRAKDYLLWLRPVRKYGRGKVQRDSYKKQYIESQMQEW